jgi:FKBP-type peptidyl-prolyl cis-trans isomerase 2
MNAMMKGAKLGDRVQVQYLGLREDGVAVKRRRGRKILEFTVGGNEVIPGISFGVLGMVEGEQKRLTLQPKDAYGPVETNLIKEVSRQRFPAHLKLRVGQRLTATGVKSGRRRQVSVAELRLHTVVVDGNHPLAGEVLEVEVQVVSLNSSSRNWDNPRHSFGA